MSSWQKKLDPFFLELNDTIPKYRQKMFRVNSSPPKLANFVTDHVLKDSSIPIISQIGNARTKVGKGLWFFILLIGLIACIYQTQRFLNIYLSYPVVITLEEKQNMALNFPGITICNLNRMKYEYERCENSDIIERGCIQSNSMRPGGMFHTHPSKSKNHFSERRDTISCLNVKNKTIGDKTKMKIEFLSKYMTMNEANREFVGHQASDLIKYCWFDGKPCSHTDFAHFPSLRYGNCYVFNKVDGSKLPLKSTSIGYTSGLELVINLEVEQYVSFTPSVGLRVLIHDITEEPNPEEVGININPGFETSIALKQTVIERLPAPYRDRCINYITRVNQSNEEECMKICLQEQSFQMCDCIDPTVMILRDLKHCNLRDETDVCCLDDVQDRIALGDSPCDCPLACTSTSYEEELSKALWPSKSAYILNRTDYYTFDYLKNNYVFLKIFYSTLIQNVYTQLPMFEECEIFSHLGGELGLWLGLTLFALLELIEVVIYFCNDLQGYFAMK
ncbi:acid-sensing ion channel 2-like [Parasteatoda tepidariorum]|uniref:acid-sensing ion channel 2-like n=1 Tax=Parasteatoda tepidariorum TaxID=114398 RepID=UPI0039BD805E